MSRAEKQRKPRSRKEPIKHWQEIDHSLSGSLWLSANDSAPKNIAFSQRPKPKAQGQKPRRKSPGCCLWMRQACLPKSINNSQVRHRNNPPRSGRLFLCRSAERRLLRRKAKRRGLTPQRAHGLCMENGKSRRGAPAFTPEGQSVRA